MNFNLLVLTECIWPLSPVRSFVLTDSLAFEVFCLPFLGPFTLLSSLEIMSASKDRSTSQPECSKQEGCESSGNQSAESENNVTGHSSSAGGGAGDGNDGGNDGGRQKVPPEDKNEDDGSREEEDERELMYDCFYDDEESEEEEGDDEESEEEEDDDLACVATGWTGQDPTQHLDAQIELAKSNSLQPPEGFVTWKKHCSLKEEEYARENATRIRKRKRQTEKKERNQSSADVEGEETDDAATDIAKRFCPQKRGDDDDSSGAAALLI